jgi:putative heme iron utilization protein
MNNKTLEKKLNSEIQNHLESRKTLFLSSLDEKGFPYASYAPFAFSGDDIFVLLSEIAVHGHNLALNPKASVMIIEDEDSAEQLFARIRVSYQVTATHIHDSKVEWQRGLDILTARHGDRIQKLSQLSDFKLFQLRPSGGRYVKGFGKAYSIAAGSLLNSDLQALTGGHRKKPTEQPSENLTPA